MGQFVAQIPAFYSAQVTGNVGIYLATSTIMAVINSISSSGAELRCRAQELAQRWLPMLLTRLGIENGVILEMRSELVDSEDLLRRLELVRAATQQVADQNRGETGDDAHSALALITELARGVSLIDADPGAAEAALGRVNQHLLGLLAGLPSATVRAGLTRSSWWSRLLSRPATRGALAS
jgi:hypothetical protein